MLKKICIDELVYKLILACCLTIFCQQVFVLNIGGSFKLYELCALLLTVAFLFNRKKIVYGSDSFVLFLWFICLASISYIFYLLNDNKFLYYFRFPESKDILRANILLAPTLLLIYYYFNWVAYNSIVGSKLVYINKNKVIRYFVISGTIVSVYNIYSFFCGYLFGFPDIIPSFLDSRNATAFFIGRVSGFSDEPGSYIFLQGWILLYLLFYEYRFKNKRWITFVNVLSALLTFSSALLAVVFVLIIGYYIKSTSVKRFKLILFLLLLLLILYQVILFFNLEDLLYYVFYEKILNLLSTPVHTLDSGSFRSYTSNLGLEIFKEYPIIGVGGGTSCFFLWKNEFNLGIEVFGEKITNMTYPQNIYAKILAEFGIIGFFLLLTLFFILIRKFWSLRNKNSIFLVGFLGVLMSLAMFSSIYPETSLFIWFNIALISNHAKFENLNYKIDESCN